MGINGITAGGFSANPMQNAQAKPAAEAPKIEDPAKSSLLDTEKEQARLEQKQDDAMKRVQEQTKQQMEVQERSASMMGFGNKMQMELLGTV